MLALPLSRRIDLLRRATNFWATQPDFGGSDGHFLGVDELREEANFGELMSGGRSVVSVKPGCARGMNINDDDN
jgi:hypothetical protein